MKFRYISTDRNPKRVWPVTSKSGVVVMVPTSHWIETEHDLSDWVGGLIQGGPVDAFVEQPPIVIAQPIAPVTVPTSQSKNPYEGMAKAMEDAFNKSVPAAPPAPVEVAIQPVVEATVEAASDEDVLEAHAEALVPSDEDGDFALLTRKVLWGLALERGLTANLEYRSTTKAELVRLLKGE
jgi:hypothetical protein